MRPPAPTTFDLGPVSLTTQEPRGAAWAQVPGTRAHLSHGPLARCSEKGPRAAGHTLPPRTRAGRQKGVLDGQTPGAGDQARRGVNAGPHVRGRSCLSEARCSQESACELVPALHPATARGPGAQRRLQCSTNTEQQHVAGPWTRPWSCL